MPYLQFDGCLFFWNGQVIMCPCWLRIHAPLFLSDHIINFGFHPFHYSNYSKYYKPTGSHPFCTLNSLTKRRVPEYMSLFCIPSATNWIWKMSFSGSAFFPLPGFCSPLYFVQVSVEVTYDLRTFWTTPLLPFGRQSSFGMVAVVLSFPFNSSGGGDLRA